MIINRLPPDFLDGAKVIKWAWSGQQPFGFLLNEDAIEKEEIFGLAICKYENEEAVYRFCCNENWDVVQDGVYNTIENAIDQLPEQYKNVKADWFST